MGRIQYSYLLPSNIRTTKIISLLFLSCSPNYLCWFLPAEVVLKLKKMPVTIL